MAVKVKNLTIDKEAGTSNNYFASWKWSNKHTDNFEIQWFWQIRGSGKWFSDGKTTVAANVKTATIQPKENANHLKVSVKPIAKKKKVKKKKKTTEVPYFKASAAYDDTFITPSLITSPTPTISLEDSILTVSVDNISSLIKVLQFQIVEDDTKLVATKWVWPSSSRHHASIQFTVSPGHKYKARTRASEYKNKETVLFYQFSPYTDNTEIIPKAVSKVNKPTALSSQSVLLTWTAVSGASSYEIQYATELRQFTSGDPSSTTSESNSKIISNLQSGNTYYFRVRAVKGNYRSTWAPANVKNAVSITLGRSPAAPTTYSITETVKLGEIADLYWIHNSRDNSSQFQAQVELIFTTSSGKYTQYVVVKNVYYTDEFRKDDNLHYQIDTSKQYSGKDSSGNNFSFNFREGVTIEWRVRTQGVTKVYGDWSVRRKVEVVVPPTLSIIFSDDVEWLWDPFNFTIDTIKTAFSVPLPPSKDVIHHLPIGLAMQAGPSTQTAIAYLVEIIANNSYTGDGPDGEAVYIYAGQTIYSEYFTESELYAATMFTANNIDLEDGQYYTLRVTVTMSTGLETTVEWPFSIDFEEATAFPNAEISIDDDDLTAMILPYCLDTFDEDTEEEPATLISDVLLSVYRRAYDGEYVLIANQIPNTRDTYVFDPHPALKNTVYRIVATFRDTGQVVYADTDPEDTDQSGAVISWNETWENAPKAVDEENEYPEDTGVTYSRVLLPYNMDIQETHDPDVELTKYIGRARPVGYYGTQLGESLTCNADIPTYDTEALASLRLLSKYPGDVYFREARTGAGYWANVKVSFNARHNTLVTPVTLNITRVEGGM